MTYFDFHFHPVFKKYITKFDASYPSARPSGDLLGEIDMKNPITDLLEEEFLNILESQACIDQVKKGNCLLGMAAIAPVERMFTSKEGIFGKILNSQFFTRPVDQQYFRKVRARDISYYQLLIREINLYKKLRDDGVLSILGRNNGAIDSKQMSVAISIEGGHSLCRTKIGRPGVEDEMPVTQHDALSADFEKNRILTPADSLRHLQQAMWDEGMDVFSVILTHLSHISEQILATHAYGMKLLKDDAVYPVGNGLSALGKEVVDAAYTLTVKKENKKVPAPVLIDIKHMSLKSRLDLYAYRRANGYEKFPLIASHMGVTGYSIDEWIAALEEADLSGTRETPAFCITMERKKAGEWGVLNKTFTYNAWSINLMDEDIENILDSDGLIGMSLDVRILGWQNVLSKGDKAEFVSYEDFRHFFPQRFSRMTKKPVAPEESFFMPTREERHPLALCFNILHIVATGKRLTQKDPWRHICIGSDFDGLISATINCRDAGKFPSLEKILLKWLPVAEAAYCKENGPIPLLPRNNKNEVDLPALRDHVHHVLYENGKKLLERWIGNKIK